MAFLCLLLYISFMFFFCALLRDPPELAHRSLPRSALHVFRRQSGYGPEHGQCDVGTTCKDSCGEEYEECRVDTDLALLCDNPVAGQKCCEDGNGSASILSMFDYSPD
jgi:hypothetical protein